MVSLLHGDCVELMRGMPDCSVDAIVTDPPYELSFMGRKWDGSGIAYSVEMWAEALRVLKPGGHLLAFGGTRTYHRMACAIEDAGFEIRDSIHWVYGSGFPKSLNVGKQNGCEAWEGWGTALKPAHEPIVVARKPLSGTVAGNVLVWGTGGLNVDGCRVPSPDNDGKVWTRGGNQQGASLTTNTSGEHEYVAANPAGRWPANVVFDWTAGEALDEQAEGASRFFTQADFGPDDWPFVYQAKPSRRERNAGLDGLEQKPTGDAASPISNRKCRKCGLIKFAQPHCTCAEPEWEEAKTTANGNYHPTVKPVALMRHLVRLVTPPGGTVLDPFAGSGTTLVAAILEGMVPLGCEMTDEYLPIIEGRMAWAHEQAAAAPLTLL